LAAEIANGRDLDEISQELAITRNTARAQPAIFHKTGCHRQAELVKLLPSLPLAGR
jgi:DNA-binding CsgD family transcriptional regulator